MNDIDYLTPRQRSVLAFIGAFSATHGYPPTIREIGEGVGLSSSSSVHGALYRLRREGFLRWEPTKPRTVTLTQIAVELMAVEEPV